MPINPKIVITQAFAGFFTDESDRFRSDSFLASRIRRWLNPIGEQGRTPAPALLLESADAASTCTGFIGKLR
jgi:hypothetical protein